VEGELDVAEGSAKKPRIRKSAPTMREKAEEARVKSEKEKPQRLSKARSKAAQPLSKVKLPDNNFGKAVRKVGRAIKRVLSFLVPRYFVNAWRELRLVTWPGRKETWRLTGAVFIFAAVFGALVAGVDKVLDVVFKHLVLK
jgi:preprotein translocase SecE subunit